MPIVGAPGSENGPISVSAAVAILDKADQAPPIQPKEKKQPAAQSQQPPAQRQARAPVEELDDEPQTQTEEEEDPLLPSARTAKRPSADEGANEETGVDDGSGSEPETIEPPKFWDAEDREKFSRLSREDQLVVLKYEANRNSYVSKKAEDAVLAARAAQQQREEYLKQTEGLQQVHQVAVQLVNDRWKDVDWRAVAEQYGPEEAFKLRQSFEREVTTVQNLGNAVEQAEKVRYEAFVAEQEKLLPTILPELQDPKFGNDRRQKLAKYLLDDGHSARAISNLSAKETRIAWKAMLWDEAQARAKMLSGNKPKPAPQTRQSVKPTAQQATSRNPNQTRISQLSAKKSLTVSEAAELLDLKGYSQQ